MKSLAYLAPFALSVLTLPVTSRAALLVYDGFDYPVAANGVSGQNGGTGWDAGWDAPANSGDIIAGSMSYTDVGGRTLVTTGNTYFGDSTTIVVGTAGAVTITNFRSFDTALNGAAGSTVYFSFLGDQTTGEGRAMNVALFTNVANNGIYTSQERISVGHGTNQPTAAGPFTWGAFVLGNGNNGGLPQVIGSNYSSTPIQTASFLVLRIDVNASGLDERYRLYVNPSLDAEPAVASVDFFRDSLVSVSEIDRIRPFAGGSTATLGAAQSNVDELRLGETWGDVTPFIPEPGSLSLLGLAAAGLLRRRRA